MSIIPATIPRTALLTGLAPQTGQAIATALEGAGFAVFMQDAPAVPVGVLVRYAGPVGGDAVQAEAAMQALAQALPAHAEGAVFTVIGDRPPPSLAAAVDQAVSVAVTRQMALTLAPCIRVNAVGPGDPATLAKAVMLLLRLPSATGQVLALDGGGPAR